MMSQRLGSNFEMFNKACYVCGSFDHSQVDCNYHQKQFQNQRMVKPVWNNAQRVNDQNFAKKTHLCAKKNMVSRAVLMKSGLVSINTARQNISKITVSVNTARQVNTAHSKTIVNAARPMSYLSKIAHSTGNPQMDLHLQGVIDSGCSRHMTGNMSYLTNYEEIDGGYVAFGMELELILVSQCISEQIPKQKKKILGGEQLTTSSSKNNAKDNPFVPASLDYDHEMVLKSKDWVERLNSDSKLPNFNTRKILTPKSKTVNECLQLIEASSNPESSKESGSEPQTPLPPLKNL
ncbi:hypothetical protein Tco_0365104 [Tanacetum coccineum]